MKKTKFRLKTSIPLILLTGFLFGQPKWSGHLGSGFYNPSLIGLDSDSNAVLPSSGVFSEKILLNWGIKYQFYPNARIGLSQSHSFHSGNLGDSKYNRILTYRMLSIETYFFIRKRMELNFSLAPMWNKGSISLTATGANADWDSILASYGNGSASLDSKGSMIKRWFGIGSMVGFKYYLFSWMAMDIKTGFIQNFYNEKNWKLNGNTVTGPKMNIKVVPVFNLNFVFGWR